MPATGDAGDQADRAGIAPDSDHAITGRSQALSRPLPRRYELDFRFVIDISTTA